jgi:hypothetical protein
VLSVEPVEMPGKVRVGEDVAVRFKLTHPGDGSPRTGLKDVRVLAFLAPGIWQQRQWATEVGKGIYEVHVKPPESGIYYVFVEVASAGLTFQKSPYMLLSVEAAPEAQASQEGAH